MFFLQALTPLFATDSLLVVNFMFSFAIMSYSYVVMPVFFDTLRC